MNQLKHKIIRVGLSGGGVSWHTSISVMDDHSYNLICVFTLHPCSSCSEDYQKNHQNCPFCKTPIKGWGVTVLLLIRFNYLIAFIFWKCQQRTPMQSSFIFSNIGRKSYHNWLFNEPEQQETWALSTSFRSSVVYALIKYITVSNTATIHLILIALVFVFIFSSMNFQLYYHQYPWNGLAYFSLICNALMSSYSYCERIAVYSYL